MGTHDVKKTLGLRFVKEIQTFGGGHRPPFYSEFWVSLGK